MTRVILLALAIWVSLPTALNAQPSQTPSGITLAPAEVAFGVLPTANATPFVTPPQRVFVEGNSEQAAAWTATADRSWLVVEPTSGSVPARLTLSIGSSALGRLQQDDEAQVAVDVRFGNQTTRHILKVWLRMIKEPHPPVGSFDAPQDGTVVTEGVRLSGWALHDIGLSRVAICRDPVRGAPPSDRCGGQAFLGDATTYYNSRPDVAALVPNAPLQQRAGWTYVLDASAFPKGARGSIRLYAVATGVDGTRSVLGVKTVVVLPGESSRLDVAPHWRALIGLIGLWAACHLLLRWFFVRRVPDGHALAPAPEPPIQAIELVAIGSIVIVFLAVNLRALSGSLTHDELYTASNYVVGKPLWTAAFDARTFTNHIAFSLLAAVSVHALGVSEFALRLPATLLGAFAILALWRYARTWCGVPAALLAGFLLSIMPFHTHWSRMARGYTGLALMTVIAIHGFSTVLKRGSARGAVEHSIGLILAAYFHLYAVFVFLTQYIVFVVLAIAAGWRSNGALHSRRRFQLLWVSFLCAAVVIAVLYSPVIDDLVGALPFFTQRGTIRGGVLVELFATFAGTDSIAARAGAGAAFVLGAIHLWRRSRFDTAHLAALILVPAGLLVLVLRPRVQLDRYFGYWSPVFALFLAAGFSLLAAMRIGVSRALRGLVVTVTLVLVVMLALLWVRRDASMGPGTGPGYREPLRTLNAPPTAPVVAIGADSGMFQYYVDERLSTVDATEDLERRLFDGAWFRVAYHDVRWNSAEQQRMAEILRRRCRPLAQGTVTMFECGR